MPPSVDELLDRFSRRDRHSLAEILTLVENGQAPALRETSAGDESPVPLVVGITGSGGAGKSTLIGSLVGHLRSAGKTVAVLASDPTSPLTGGALLGDRIRVRFDPADEGVYFRSFSTRGAQGGVAAATGPALGWLAAFGFDVVLVETVGVGQDQIGVRPLVDRLVLLVTPGTGDEVQWEKAGLIEVVDLVVVNKCDLPGAESVQAQLASSLSLAPEQTPPPILGVTATTGAGVAELYDALFHSSGAGSEPEDFDKLSQGT